MSTLELAVVDGSRRVGDVWDLLLAYGVQHAPVMDGEQLVGLVSSWDIAKRAMHDGPAVLLDTPVEQLMETRLVTLGPRDSVRHAAELLAEGGFHSLPVLDESGSLVGILTSTDLLRFCLGLGDRDGSRT